MVTGLEQSPGLEAKGMEMLITDGTVSDSRHMVIDSQTRIYALT